MKILILVLRTKKETSDFGNFEAAFGSETTPKQSSDDFADFSSAFSETQNFGQSANIVQSPPQAFIQQQNIQPQLIGSPTQPQLVTSGTNLFGNTTEVTMPTTTNNQSSNSDLLSDLTGFNSLSIQQSGGFGISPSNNNQNLLMGSNTNNILDGFGTGNVLQSSSAQVLQPTSSTSQNQQTDNMSCYNSNKAAVGATWSNSGNLNIDLDNLLGNKKNKQGSAPSMNQLASTPTSPINQPRAMAQNNMNHHAYGRPINYPNSGFNQANNQFFTAFK